MRIRWRGMGRTALVVAVLASTLAVSAAPGGAVVGGAPVSDDRFEERWAPTVRLEIQPGNGTCSGMVIAPTWVLTAAHCVDGSPDSVTVQYGSRSRFGLSSTVATTVILHPGYDRSVLGDQPDVALLQLPDDIPVRPFGLAGTTPVVQGEPVEVAGWGWTTAGDSQSLPDTLQESELTVTQVRDGLILTTGATGTVCPGDSGGPMVDPTTGRLIGVASFTTDGCTSTAGHVEVAPVLPWILGTTGGLDPIAGPDEYRVVPDQVLGVPAPGVLANDTTYGPNPTLFVTEAPGAGDVVLNDDGSFTYTPDDGFVGQDGFAYVIDDEGRTADALVTIVVNQPPIAADDVVHAPLDTDTAIARVSLAAPGVLANDVDPDGLPLVARPLADLVVAEGVTAVQLGLTADGTVDVELDLSLIDPEGDVGQTLVSDGVVPVAAFTYRVTDGVETSAPARVEILVCLPEVCPDPGPDPPPPGLTLEIGDTLADLVAQTADGGTWSLADVTDEVVVLHLCAVWCGPCQELATRLGSELADLEADLGAGAFEVVEVLVEDANGLPSDADDAAAWSTNFSGDGVTVLHANDEPGSPVLQLATALGVTAYPTLVILDRNRRIADVRTPTLDPFRDAIAHGQAVGALPLDLPSYEAAGPSAVDVTLGSEVVSGALSDDPTALSQLGTSPFFAAQERSVPEAGAIEWWRRTETRIVTVLDTGPFSGGDTTFDPSLPIELSLTGPTWTDGFDRSVTAVAELLAIGSTELETVAVIDEVSAALTATGLQLGPVTFDPAEGAVGVRVTVSVAPVIDEVDDPGPGSLAELAAAVSDAGLPTGAAESLLAKLGAAQLLLGDDEPANDRGAAAILRAAIRQLERGQGRTVPADLADAWIAAVEEILGAG